MFADKKNSLILFFLWTVPSIHSFPSPSSLQPLHPHSVTIARPSHFHKNNGLHLASDSQKESQKSNSQVTFQPNARTVAASALLELNGKEEFPLRRLEKDPNFHQLHQRDRRFARNLVSTVERRKGQLDKVLAACVDKPLGKPRGKQDALIRATIRLGAAQLLLLDTPPHAALKETVDILRSNSFTEVAEPKIKFVNAILRRIQRERNTRNFLESDSSIYDNIAPWLLKEWRKTWGKEKVAAIAKAAMEESPIYISVNHKLGATEEDKLERLQHVRDAFVQKAAEKKENSTKVKESVEILPHGSLYIDKTTFPGIISMWPLYRKGDWWVQDASATLPAIALYNSLLKGNGNPDLFTIVDMCAAPGGKTAQLLSLGFPSVTAVESSSKRAKLLQSNLSRLRFEDRCSVVVADGSTWTPPSGLESISGILLDVPCSATGTASRRPDVLRRPQGLKALLETQYKLATHCIDNVLQPGGVMVYATCSLLKQESEDQVQKILERQNGAKVALLPFVKGEIPGFDDAIDDDGCLRVIPGMLPGKLSTCDGFFVARFRKA